MHNQRDLQRHTLQPKERIWLLSLFVRFEDEGSSCATFIHNKHYSYELWWEIIVARIACISVSGNSQKFLSRFENVILPDFSFAYRIDLLILRTKFFCFSSYLSCATCDSWYILYSRSCLVLDTQARRVFMQEISLNTESGCCCACLSSYKDWSMTYVSSEV